VRKKVNNYVNGKAVLTHPASYSSRKRHFR